MPSPEEWSSQLADAGQVEIRGSRRKIFAALLAALVFSAIFAVMTQAGSVALAAVGWFGLAFFGVLGIPVCVYKLMVARVELEVTPQGLRTVQTGDTMIAWSSIEEVSLTWVSSVAFVVLVLSEPAYAELMDTTSGRVKSTANRLVIGERTIGLPNGLSAEPAALAKWLEAERVARSGPAR